MSYAFQKEHERKFLVTDDVFIESLGEGMPIVQGYVDAETDVSIRVRYLPLADVYQLTLKSSAPGITRTEVEQGLQPDVGELFLYGCGERLIEKRRVPAVGPDGRGWDIDVFHGRHAGLVVAEVELEAADVAVEVPSWCGPEVTGDARYLNENLSRSSTPPT